MEIEFNYPPTLPLFVEEDKNRQYLKITCQYRTYLASSRRCGAFGHSVVMYQIKRTCASEGLIV